MTGPDEQREKSIEERARFDLIRYAGCWEDADVLLGALKVKAGGAYLSIASAGDNSLSLLAGGPAKVVAVDMNPAQLACVELKKFSFTCLSYGELLEFLGARESSRRRYLYGKVRTFLSGEARMYWDTHPELIERGVIHTGKFERYFHLFRKIVLPLVHTRGTVRQLLEPKDRDGRLQFYRDRWDTPRWKFLFRIFFSRRAMGRLGRDPEFFKYVATDVAGRIFRRAEYALTELPTHDNPYLEYILTGNFGRSLPHYLRRENYGLIRERADRLIIFKGNLNQALDADRQARYDGFNLSDIFEYMSPAEYAGILAGLWPYARTGGRLVYWNMLADRKDAPGLEGKIRFLDAEAGGLFRRDKAFFYKSLIIGEAV